MTLRPSRHFTTRIALCALVLAVFFAPIWAPVRPAFSTASGADSQEQKKQDEPLLRIETELVQIDVVVTDKQGKLARDLKRGDFELFDDGKKQEITHFAVGTASQPARWLAAEKKKPDEKSTAASAPVEIRAGRYIVIAVDDFHLAPE